MPNVTGRGQLLTPEPSGEPAVSRPRLPSGSKVVGCPILLLLARIATDAPGGSMHSVGRSSRVRDSQFGSNALHQDARLPCDSQGTWRGMTKLRIEDAQAVLSHFDTEIAVFDSPLVPRLRELTRIVGAWFLLMARHGNSSLQEALDLLEKCPNLAPDSPRGQFKLRAELSDGSPRLRAKVGVVALSPREHSILRYMSAGLSNKRMARKLGVAPETVKSHLKGIFIKLGVRTRAHAVSLATARGLL